MNQAPSMLKPALISGAACGVVGSIFVLGLGACAQCTCCALIVGCGFLAAFLYSKDCRTAAVSFGAGNGATVGLTAGLVYGIVSGISGSLFIAIFGIGDWREVIEQIQASGADIDPVMVEQLSNFLDGSGQLVIVLSLIFISLLFGAIFGTIGGLIGGSIFKVEEPRPGMYTQTPQPPPPPVG